MADEPAEAVGDDCEVFEGILPVMVNFGLFVKDTRLRDEELYYINMFVLLGVAMYMAVDKDS